MSKEIMDAINDGIRLTDMTTEKMKEKFLETIKALDFMGMDFSFFENDVMLNRTVDTIKAKYGYFTDQELMVIISWGCQNEFKRTAQIVKGYHLFSWINEYLSIRRKTLADHRDTFDEDQNIDKVDLFKHPMGKAIKWKIERVKGEDWDKIPSKEIAEVIKNKGNLRTLAESYNIELINRN